MDKNKLRVALGGKDNHAKDKEYFWYYSFMILGITALLMALLIYCLGCGGISDNKSGETSAVLIKYVITGKVLCTCENPKIEITYRNSTGGYETIDTFIVPWEYEFEVNEKRCVGCMAQYNGENEVELKTELYQDGKLIDEMYSKGKISIVSFVERCIE